MNEDIRALVKTLYKTKTLERAHQEGFYQVFCRKILKIINLSQILSSKMITVWSSKSIINSKNNVKNL